MYTEYTEYIQVKNAKNIVRVALSLSATLSELWEVVQGIDTVYLCLNLGEVYIAYKQIWYNSPANNSPKANDLVTKISFTLKAESLLNLFN